MPVKFSFTNCPSGCPRKIRSQQANAHLVPRRPALKWFSDHTGATKSRPSSDPSQRSTCSNASVGSPGCCPVQPTATSPQGITPASSRRTPATASCHCIPAIMGANKSDLCDNKTNSNTLVQYPPSGSRGAYGSDPQYIGVYL